MTEQEKMLAAEAYWPRNPELLGLYQRARGLLAGGYVTRALPISIGDNCWIGGGAMIMPKSFAAGNPCRVMSSARSGEPWQEYTAANSALSTGQEQGGTP